MSLADLQEDEVAFRKSKLITEDVLGKNCLSSMAWILPKTKMGSVVKKTWQTVMEAHVAVNTADGCLLVYSVLVLLKSQPPDSEDLLGSAWTGLPNPEDEENRDPEIQTSDLKEVSITDSRPHGETHGKGSPRYSSAPLCLC